MTREWHGLLLVQGRNSTELITESVIMLNSELAPLTGAAASIVSMTRVRSIRSRTFNGFFSFDKCFPAQLLSFDIRPPFFECMQHEPEHLL